MFRTRIKGYEVYTYPSWYRARGARRSEIFALTKKDVDLKKKIVIINMAVIFDGNKSVLKLNPSLLEHSSIGMAGIAPEIYTHLDEKNDNTISI